MEIEDTEENIQGCKLRCSDVPKDLLLRTSAKKHFDQFGKIVRIILKPRSKQCIIEYQNTEQAQTALLNAGNYMGQWFPINWYEKPVTKKKQIQRDPDPDWVPDSEVEAELAAMAGTGSGFKKTYNLRPELMSVDPFMEPVPIKTKKIIRNRKSKPVEKLAKNASKDPNVWTSEQRELLNILKQPSFTADEKFKVLDARDKLIRLRSKQSLDLAKLTHRIGTCPDMCPEKERLLREIQHQIAFYEQDASGRGMNPMLAVKQYSRSSADQEVPLPHELRPVAVLQMTMEYLMHRIMNLCDTPDVNFTEWYHFLWDRTRSIRKDITQQELCCQNSVALLEQCTRFHVHCSARLVAEDPSVFDQKINTENLTKCLQTLKYMYHDLLLKGESCPNEAEFRAYVILLNLNDGNFMWEVQQLKQEIQKSPEVHFALKVHSAIDKNNYVKFFKLVKSTNYLNACILLRYFIQVRTKALSTMVRCFSPRAPCTLFSLSELEQLLAFEDMDSVKDFVVSYGLYFNPEKTHIVLDRKSFQLPEMPFTLERAIKVVESKRSNSVGEVVYGGFLPSPRFQNYVPLNSFDQNGVFIIPEMMNNVLKGSSSEDQVDTSTKVEQLKPENVSKVMEEEKPKATNLSAPFWSIGKPQASSSIFKSSTSISRTGIFDSSKNKTAIKNIFASESDEAKPTQNVFGGFVPPQVVPDPGLNLFKNPPKTTSSIFGTKTELGQGANAPKFPFSNAQPGGSLSGFIKPFGLHSRALQSESRQLEVAKREEAERLKREEMERIRMEEMEKQRLEEMERSKREEMEKLKREEMERLKREEIERLKELQEQKRREVEEMKRKAELRQKQLEEERRQKEELQRLEIERRRKLEDERRRQRALQIERERKRAEEIKNSVASLMNDLLTRVEEKCKRDRLDEIKTNIQNHKQSMFVEKWRNKVTLNKRKRKAMDQNPIWLCPRTTDEEAQELFTDTQSLTLQNIKRYKKGRPEEIILPAARAIPKMNVARIHETLLRSYVKICQRLQKEMFWKVTVSLPDFHELKLGLSYVENVLMEFFGWQDRYGGTSRVGQYFEGNRFTYCIEKKQGVLPTEGNSNALLFIAQEPSETLINRISTSLSNFPRSSHVPVCVLFLTDDPSRLDTEVLEETLEENEHVSRLKITSSKFLDTAITEITEEGLKFLAEYVQVPPPLELNTLSNLVRCHVVTEPWERIRSYAIWNYKYECCLKHPNLVIGLHNEAVERLKELVLDKSAWEYQNFPDEFDKFLMNETPEVLPCDFKHFPSFWKTDSYQSLLRKKLDSLKLPEYKSTWPPLNENKLEQDICNYCTQIFNEPQPVFYKTMAAILQHITPSENFDDIKEVLWINVVEVIATEKLNYTDFSLQQTEFYSKSIYEQLIAVYNVSCLQAHANNEWFYLKNPAVESEMKKETPRRRIRPKPEEKYVPPFSKADLDELERSLKQESKVDLSQKSSIEEIENMMADLEESMEIHKKICKNFQKTVRDALNLQEV